MQLADIQARYPDAAIFKFGDSRSLCDELLALVRSGKKVATCGALREFEIEGEVLPTEGRRDIALDWDGMPALVIETLSVSLIRFRDVDESFALAEGENDSLEGWREDHRRYFERNGGFDPAMILVCERFRLVEDFGSAGGASTDGVEKGRDMAIDVAQVSLREITAHSVRVVTDLAVEPGQASFVASNAVSLAEANFNPEAWYRAVYLDDEPVGFVMLYDESLRPDPPSTPEIAIWRFMIDAGHQRRGIGAEALRQVIEHVRGKAIFDALMVSYVPGSGSPEGFYLAAGFEHTGLVDEGEIVLRLKL